MIAIINVMIKVLVRD
jgi:hypothetical protein